MAWKRSGVCPVSLRSSGCRFAPNPLASNNLRHKAKREIPDVAPNTVSKWRTQTVYGATVTISVTNPISFKNKLSCNFDLGRARVWPGPKLLFAQAQRRRDEWGGRWTDLRAESGGRD
jgi:hypothetical protein